MFRVSEFVWQLCCTTSPASLVHAAAWLTSSNVVLELGDLGLGGGVEMP